MRRRRIGRVGRPSLVATAARTAVVAGTATAVSGRVAARHHGAAEQHVAAEHAASVSAPPAAGGAAGAVTDEVVDQLRKLGELRDAGILTDEEFAAKKAGLLGI